jgi:hypothetical protein
MIPLPYSSLSIGIFVASTHFRNLTLPMLITLYPEEELKGIGVLEEQKLL